MIKERKIIMSPITNLMHALNERTIAREVGLRHDEARMRFALGTNTVADFDEFSNIIGNYVNHHYGMCISRGGRLSQGEARSLAKSFIEREYQRRKGNIVSAFNDAHDGTNGGLRAILDIIADALKAQSTEHYVRDLFDRHVAPNSWDDKVAIIREFLHEFRAYLPPDIRTDQSERFAQNYEELIRAYVEGLRGPSAMIRRL